MSIILKSFRNLLCWAIFMMMSMPCWSVDQLQAAPLALIRDMDGYSVVDLGILSEISGAFDLIVDGQKIGRILSHSGILNLEINTDSNLKIQNLPSTETLTISVQGAVIFDTPVTVKKRGFFNVGGPCEFKKECTISQLDISCQKFITHDLFQAKVARIDAELIHNKKEMFFVHGIMMANQIHNDKKALLKTNFLTILPLDGKAICCYLNQGKTLVSERFLGTFHSYDDDGITAVKGAAIINADKGRITQSFSAYAAYMTFQESPYFTERTNFSFTHHLTIQTAEDLILKGRTLISFAPSRDVDTRQFQPQTTEYLRMMQKKGAWFSAKKSIRYDGKTHTSGSLEFGAGTSFSGTSSSFMQTTGIFKKGDLSIQAGKIVQLLGTQLVQSDMNVHGETVIQGGDREVGGTYTATASQHMIQLASDTLRAQNAILFGRNARISGQIQAQKDILIQSIHHTQITKSAGLSAGNTSSFSSDTLDMGASATSTAANHRILTTGKTHIGGDINSTQDTLIHSAGPVTISKTGSITSGENTVAFVEKEHNSLRETIKDLKGDDPSFKNQGPMKAKNHTIITNGSVLNDKGGKIQSSEQLGIDCGALHLNAPIESGKSVKIMADWGVYSHQASIQSPMTEINALITLSSESTLGGDKSLKINTLLGNFSFASLFPSAQATITAPFNLQIMSPVGCWLAPQTAWADSKAWATTPASISWVDTKAFLTRGLPFLGSYIPTLNPGIKVYQVLASAQQTIQAFSTLINDWDSEEKDRYRPSRLALKLSQGVDASNAAFQLFQSSKSLLPAPSDTSESGYKDESNEKSQQDLPSLSLNQKLSKIWSVTKDIVSPLSSVRVRSFASYRDSFSPVIAGQETHQALWMKDLSPTLAIESTTYALRGSRTGYNMAEKLFLFVGKGFEFGRCSFYFDKQMKPKPLSVEKKPLPETHESSQDSKSGIHVHEDDVTLSGNNQDSDEPTSESPSETHESSQDSKSGIHIHEDDVTLSGNNQDSEIIAHGDKELTSNPDNKNEAPWIQMTSDGPMTLEGQNMGPTQIYESKGPLKTGENFIADAETVSIKSQDGGIVHGNISGHGVHIATNNGDTTINAHINIKNDGQAIITLNNTESVLGGTVNDNQGDGTLFITADKTPQFSNSFSLNIANAVFTFPSLPDFISLVEKTGAYQNCHIRDYLELNVQGQVCFDRSVFSSPTSVRITADSFIFKEGIRLEARGMASIIARETDGIFEPGSGIAAHFTQVKAARDLLMLFRLQKENLRDFLDRKQQEANFRNFKNIKYTYRDTDGKEYGFSSKDPGYYLVRATGKGVSFQGGKGVPYRYTDPETGIETVRYKSIELEAGHKIDGTAFWLNGLHDIHLKADRGIKNEAESCQLYRGKDHKRGKTHHSRTALLAPEFFAGGLVSKQGGIIVDVSHGSLMQRAGVVSAHDIIHYYSLRDMKFKTIKDMLMSNKKRDYKFWSLTKKGDTKKTQEIISGVTFHIDEGGVMRHFAEKGLLHLDGSILDLEGATYIPYGGKGRRFTNPVAKSTRKSSKTGFSVTSKIYPSWSDGFDAGQKLLKGDFTNAAQTFLPSAGLTYGTTTTKTTQYVTGPGYINVGTWQQSVIPGNGPISQEGININIGVCNEKIDEWTVQGKKLNGKIAISSTTIGTNLTPGSVPRLNLSYGESTTTSINHQISQLKIGAFTGDISQLNVTNGHVDIQNNKGKIHHVDIQMDPNTSSTKGWHIGLSVDPTGETPPTLTGGIYHTKSSNNSKESGFKVHHNSGYVGPVKKRKPLTEYADRGFGLNVGLTPGNGSENGCIAVTPMIKDNGESYGTTIHYQLPMATQYRTGSQAAILENIEEEETANSPFPIMMPQFDEEPLPPLPHVETSPSIELIDEIDEEPLLPLPHVKTSPYMELIDEHELNPQFHLNNFNTDFGRLYQEVNLYTPSSLKLLEQPVIIYGEPFIYKLEGWNVYAQSPEGLQFAQESLKSMRNSPSFFHNDAYQAIRTTKTHVYFYDREHIPPAAFGLRENFGPGSVGLIENYDSGAKIHIASHSTSHSPTVILGHEGTHLFDLHRSNNTSFYPFETDFSKTREFWDAYLADCDYVNRRLNNGSLSPINSKLDVYTQPLQNYYPAQYHTVLDQNIGPAVTDSEITLRKTILDQSLADIAEGNSPIGKYHDGQHYGDPYSIALIQGEKYGVGEIHARISELHPEQATEIAPNTHSFFEKHHQPPVNEPKFRKRLTRGVPFFMQWGANLWEQSSNYNNWIDKGTAASISMTADIGTYTSAEFVIGMVVNAFGGPVRGTLGLINGVGTVCTLVPDYDEQKAYQLDVCDREFRLYDDTSFSPSINWKIANSVRDFYNYMHDNISIPVTKTAMEVVHDPRLPPLGSFDDDFFPAPMKSTDQLRHPDTQAWHDRQ